MNCENLKVIPQFVGSCWFNSFLMSTLYSQYARKMIIKESINWDKKDKFFNILKYILKKNYNDPSIATYYNHLQPQLLLFKFLKKFDINTEKYIKKKIKQNILNFGWFKFYYPSFIKKLTPKVLDIYHDYKTNTNIINLHKTIDLIINDDDDYTYKYNDSYNNIVKEKKEILNIINNIPDFIILFHSELQEFKGIELFYDYLNKTNKNLADVYNSSSYDFIIDGIKDYKDIITFNGINYKLDSCLLENYNNPSHTIVGITCNNNKYVYNGWSNKTYVPTMKDKFKSGDNFPCSLMKYDWDLRKDEDFCLNPKLCKLDFEIDKEDLCFSFGKSDRILVYVRMDDLKTPKLSSLSSNKVKLSNVNELIKDIYQIDDLNKKELINHILFFKKKINLDEKTEQELDEIIIDYFKIYTDFTMKSKIDNKKKFINNFLIKDYETLLNLKTNDELKEIFFDILKSNYF